MGVEIHGKHHGTMMEFSLSQTVKDILAHLSTHYPEQNHTQQQTPIHHSQDLRSSQLEAGSLAQLPCGSSLIVPKWAKKPNFGRAVQLAVSRDETRTL